MSDAKAVDPTSVRVRSVFRIAILAFGAVLLHELLVEVLDKPVATGCSSVPPEVAEARPGYRAQAFPVALLGAGLLLYAAVGLHSSSPP